MEDQMAQGYYNINQQHQDIPRPLPTMLAPFDILWSNRILCELDMQLYGW